MKKVIMMIVFAVVLAMNVQAVQAAAVLNLNDGISSVTVVDNGVGDLNPLVGAITFSGPLDNWSVNVTTGVSKPILGSSILPTLDLNSINVSSTGPSGDLKLTFSDTGFNFNGSLLTQAGGTTTGNIAIQTLLNGSAITSLGPFTGAFSGSATSGSVSIAPVDTLSLFADIMHGTGGGNSSFNSQVHPRVPEPGTLMLLGSGLFSVAFFARRKRV